MIFLQRKKWILTLNQNFTEVGPLGSGNGLVHNRRQAIVWTNDDPDQWRICTLPGLHYNDVIMGAIASQITSLTIVYLTVYSDTDQRKHQSSASLAFVRGIHRRPVNSPHKWPVTRKVFPFDDVIMLCCDCPQVAQESGGDEVLSVQTAHETSRLQLRFEQKSMVENSPSNNHTVLLCFVLLWL